MIQFSQASLGAFSLVLLLFQGAAFPLLLSRLFKGVARRPPLQPKQPKPDDLGAVSIVIPTLNEAARIEPCLQGVSRQSYELREAIVVDSYSQDGTPDKVKAVQAKDSRFRLINDPPLPAGWVGRPWALHNGFLASSEHSEWVLGIDADTQPQPGLVASLIQAAEEEGYDLLSLSPQFILKHPGEWWLQPALLMTLIYRFDSAGVRKHQPERVMANGQCFLVRRSLLVKLNGYSSAATSFCDDVTLARKAALEGFKVGFLDGAKVIRVRMYEGMAETWREWGRSLDLKDASASGQLWNDLWLLLTMQALPLPLSLILFTLYLSGYDTIPVLIVTGLNLILVLIRLGMNMAIAPSYHRDSNCGLTSWLFWLSPLADTLAVARIFLSAQQKPNQWRGREYSN